ncbi:hypothetical protein B566_EDAN015778 [Ephemera danica]|nr:hypothetical protein B566_EDAN015778 [Ephemera danica]
MQPSCSFTTGGHLKARRRNTEVGSSMHSSTPNSGGGRLSLQGSQPPPPRRDPTAASVLYATTPSGPSSRTAAALAGGGSQEAISGAEDETQLFLLMLDCQLTPIVGNGSSELLGTPAGGDDDASATPDIQRARHAIERVQCTIRKNLCSTDNVNEYLKCAASADRQQLVRIKAVFEKKNQKSAQAIAGLQRKLEAYKRKKQDLDSTMAAASAAGSSRGSDTSAGHTHHRQPREVLRDMGQGLKNVGGNIRDGITGFSGTVMSKPREFAHLIKNKFGSADNINSLGKSSFYTGIEESGGSEEEQSQQSQRVHHGSATLPAQSSAQRARFHHGSEEGASECSSATSGSLPPTGSNHPQHNNSNSSHGATQHTTVTGEAHHSSQHTSHHSNVQAEQQFSSQALLDERFRVERLEEQLNDLTELHQTEVENLKTQVADSEEKVQYQSEERLRDIHEMLEACQTKISKMEHQQHQHQQYVTLEGIHNSNARALVVKLINVVLTVLQVVLLLVATTAGIAMPFLKTRLRVLTTVLLVAGIVFIVKQWPEVRDVGSHLMRHIKQALTVK